MIKKNIHIRYLKHTLNLELVLEKLRKVIKFNQESWLKPYIDINAELRKKGKNDFEKYIFKLMNNAVFGKTIKNVIKQRYQASNNINKKEPFSV